MTGIYCIENKVNGLKYIGQSVDIEKRWKLHKKKLNNNAHYNVHLQNAWNLYGIAAFSFYIVEQCEKDYLDEREMYYIQMFDTQNNGYNMTSGGEGTRGCLHTEEWKEKMRILNTGKTMSDESKEKMRIAKKGKPQKITEKRIEGHRKTGEKLKGRTRTKEHCKHLSEALKGNIPWNKGIKMPEEYVRARIGKHHTEETKKKLAMAQTGRTKSIETRLKISKSVKCVETGEIFGSITFAAEKYGVSIYSISNALRGKAKTSCNMHWEYAEKR